ncbi:STAS domain-containing protein [Sesbania bispinosa]|nr:STAS domain-containing protein [Sesbania bispinosa]
MFVVLRPERQKELGGLEYYYCGGKSSNIPACAMWLHPHPYRVTGCMVVIVSVLQSASTLINIYPERDQIINSHSQDQLANYIRIHTHL